MRNGHQGQIGNRVPGETGSSASPDQLHKDVQAGPLVGIDSLAWRKGGAVSGGAGGQPPGSWRCESLPKRRDHRPAGALGDDSLQAPRLPASRNVPKTACSSLPCPITLRACSSATEQRANAPSFWRGVGGRGGEAEPRWLASC